MPLSLKNGRTTSSFLHTMGVLLFLLTMEFSSIVSASEYCIGMLNSKSLRLSPNFTTQHTYFERVKIQELSRIRDLKKFSHSIKVTVSINSTIQSSVVQVCFHRNLSRGIGMCLINEWDKVTEGQWVQDISPFEHYILDLRRDGMSHEIIDVSIEEEFRPYRIVFLVMGTTLMALASSFSKSILFYYGGAISMGIVLVILMILLQGMRLLPTGQRGSLAIFMYSSFLGLGTFLLRYLPKLIDSLFAEINIGEEIYYHLLICTLGLVALVGAWLGFWAVQRLIIKEDGSVDANLSYFVAWFIRILGSILILQSTLDPLLAAQILLLFGLPTIMGKFIRWKPFQKLLRLFKRRKRRQRNADPIVDDECAHGISRPISFDSPNLFTPTYDVCRGSPRPRSNQGSYFSTFHTMAERRKFSEDDWKMLTKRSTKIALEELVSSPDFSKWAVSHAESITLSPGMGPGKRRGRQYWPCFF